MRSWEGDRACLKALMSNRGKREMTKYNPANNVCLVDKKQRWRERLRKAGRHSGTFSYIRLLDEVCTVADFVLTVCAYADLTLDMTIHYLRFPGAIKPAGQLNNGPFLICFLWNRLVSVCSSACVCLYLNRAGPPHPTECHMSLEWRFPAQVVILKSQLWLWGRITCRQADEGRRGGAEGGKWKKKLPPDVLIH